MSDDLLENLNKEQLQAVMHTKGSLMIIAGAGTGKTTVISHRIAWLIDQGYAKPEEILALTFTEKAATEMEERVDRLLPIGYIEMWISTFHSFCERVLKENAIEIGLPHEFVLLNEVDTLLMMRRNFEKFNLNYYKPRGNPTRFIKALLQHFSRLKDEMISVEDYFSYTEKIKEDKEIDEVELERIQELAESYQIYQEILLENNAFDFADLIVHTVDLLKKRPKILKEYQDKFKFILVDEFQDTNKAQYELVKLLTGTNENLTIVGDDDQSIYRFRGASISNIFKFKSDFPNATNVVLIKNYRSKSEILDKSYHVIQNNNPHRLEVQEEINKKLIAHKEGKGKVEHYHFNKLEDEVNAVIKKVVQLKTETECEWGDFCILVRANNSADPFISAFEKEGIPYKFLALSGLYMKPIILDAVAWMRAIHQPHDSTAIYRILSHDKLGLEEKTISSLTMECKIKACSIYDQLQDFNSKDIDNSEKERIKEILEILSNLQELNRRLPVNELFVDIIKQTGLLGNIRHLSEIEQMEEFSFLNQFYKRIQKFESSNTDRSLAHFLEEFEHERSAGEIGALESDAETGPDVVNIMTIHSSKGLEFDYVFIVNLVEQRFPAQRRSDPIAIPDELLDKNLLVDDPHIAEERRLFYVALTRARKEVFLYSAENYGGVRKRKQSRFIEELGIESFNFTDSASLERVNNNSVQKKYSYELPSSISFTQIAAFSTCPLQYKFSHILKVPVFGRHTSSFGRSMHNTLHKFMKELVKNSSKLPSRDQLFKLYDESWIDEWYPSEEVKKEYREIGEESLKDYYRKLEDKTPDIFALEKGFTLKIGDITIRGRIDRIDKDGDFVKIIDYKTGKPKTRVDWKQKRQLVLYVLACERCFKPPLKVSSVIFHYLEDNSILELKVTDKDRERLILEVKETVEKIKNSDFKPTPGFDCGFCDFKDICEFADN